LVARRSAVALHLVASARGIPLPGIRHERDIVVWLIVYYVIFMIAGDLAAYAIGLVTEREFGGQVSLIVFLVLYFLFLWVAWVLAVWITKPSHVEPAST
jgi:cation transporter-like permease